MWTGVSLLVLVSTTAAQTAPTNRALVDGTVIESTRIGFVKAKIALMAEKDPLIRTWIDRISIKRFTYLSDGLKVAGYIVIPTGKEKLPCIIFNRGGHENKGHISDSGAALVLGRLASWGYIVVASQYRGNQGGSGQEEYGGADVMDVVNLIKVLDSVPRADTSRIGMYGVSRGGMMTYLALTHTDRISAAVVVSGLTDLLADVQRHPEIESDVYARLIPNYRNNRVEALAARSAIRWPQKICKSTPLLIIHGGADKRVHPSQALRMAEALTEIHHPFQLVVLIGGIHGLRTYSKEKFDMTKDWFDQHVRDGHLSPTKQEQE